jgi:hypothetical protein
MANLVNYTTITVNNMTLAAAISKGYAVAPLIYVNNSQITLDNLTLFISTSCYYYAAGLILLSNASTVTVSGLNSSVNYTFLGGNIP